MKNLVVLALIFVVIVGLASADETQRRPTLWSGLSDYSPTLKRFREPELWNLDERPESYRIYIDSSIVFRETTIRLDRLSSDRWKLTTKARFRDRWQVWTRRLKSIQVEEALARLNDPRFWQLPTDMMFTDPNEKEGELSSICLDGTYWIIEARVAERYHGSGVQICFDRDDVFVPAGLALMKLTRRNLGPVGEAISEEELRVK